MHLQYTPHLRGIMAILLLTYLFSVVFAVTQYGCRLSNSNCSGNGYCELTGICTCKSDYIGDNCEKKVDKIFKQGKLGKGFITFWVLFWVCLNLFIPFLIFLLIKYCKDKNCDEIKNLMETCREAVFCCFKKKENESPDNLNRRSESNIIQPNNRGATVKIAEDINEKELVRSSHSLHGISKNRIDIQESPRIEMNPQVVAPKPPSQIKNEQRLDINPVNSQSSKTKDKVKRSISGLGKIKIDAGQNKFHLGLNLPKTVTKPKQKRKEFEEENEGGFLSSSSPRSESNSGKGKKVKTPKRIPQDEGENEILPYKSEEDSPMSLSDEEEMEQNKLTSEKLHSLIEKGIEKYNFKMSTDFENKLKSLPIPHGGQLYNPDNSLDTKIQTLLRKLKKSSDLPYREEIFYNLTEGNTSLDNI